MHREHERNLEILTALGEGAPVTQRALAQQLGVALGLANLCLKRLASKGLIKVMEFPAKPSARKRLRYVLTPKGVAEKTRLSYEYMAYSLRLFRRTRGNLREMMARLHADGMDPSVFRQRLSAWQERVAASSARGWTTLHDETRLADLLAEARES